MILVTGSDGLVSSFFVEKSKHRSELHAPKNLEFDLTNRSQIRAIISSYDLSAIVNFAAYTELLDAEKERGDKKGECWDVNVNGVANIVEGIAARKDRKIHFIQISTSRVFSGSAKDRGPYDEKHLSEKDPEKLSWYGYTKSKAEKLIKDVLGDSATIVRLANVVGNQIERKN